MAYKVHNRAVQTEIPVYVAILAYHFLFLSYHFWKRYDALFLLALVTQLKHHKVLIIHKKTAGGHSYSRLIIHRLLLLILCHHIPVTSKLCVITALHPYSLCHSGQVSSQSGATSHSSVIKPSLPQVKTSVQVIKPQVPPQSSVPKPCVEQVVCYFKSRTLI